ncbi:MAG: LL-diaminopimelate aminotransferase [Candidatus Aerophobetes bacterium]|nr:LL-diaminopimelate aminotransferase [Candidatus Aerophobetes bacterium]
MKIEKAERLTQIPPYLFALLDKLKKELREKGKNIIDLGVGDPDLPTPSPIIEKLSQAAQNPENHRYPSYKGLLSFRQAISQWYRRRFGVELDPQNEIITLIGSKEGIAHLPLCLINPGDLALVPEPAYPVYRAGVIFAGGKPFTLPLLEEKEFLPRIEDIEEKIARKAKILFLNYPHNPTGAVADKNFFKKVVEFAKKFNVVICHDLAYSEIFFTRQRPPSLLEVKGGKEVGIEFHSLSKTFNMTGWRIGFAGGNKELIKSLGEVKTNIDSGVFQAIQEAGIEALKREEELNGRIRRIYQKRRDIMVKSLREIGWKISVPRATFYLWIKLPKGSSSLEFTEKLMEQCEVVVTPGIGFGSYGEGYIRISLTVAEEKIKEAVKRIKEDKIISNEISKCQN